MDRNKVNRWVRPAAVGILLASVAGLVFSQAKDAGLALRTVTVLTQPQAKVWIDGVFYGTTSEEGVLTVSTIGPGGKTVKIRADGFKETQKLLAPGAKGNFAVPLARTTDEAELAFQEAERFSTVDREKAAAAYERALKLRPGFPEAHIGLARIYSETSEITKAEKAIAAARRAKPGLAEASAIEGRVLKGIGEEVKAIASFKRAIREGGGFQPEAYAGLGLLYKEKAEASGAEGDYELETANYTEAARNLSMAIRQLSGAPDSVVLYQFLGLVYEQQKKFDKAIAVYQEFLRLFPGHSESSAFESFITQLKKQSAEQ